VTAARASVIAADIRARVAAPVLVVAAVVAAFSPALSAGFVNWDDPGLVLENPHFRGLDAARLRWMLASFHMGHWHPLTWLTFALDHALWGMDPRGYHLTNLALHALTALLVYALARRLFAVTGAAEPARTLAAAVAALLFAVHPLRVESVGWVTERRDVVSAPLLVLAVLAWLRFAERGGRAWYAASLVAFALSLLGKAWGITLPAILLLLDAWPLRRIGRVPVARLVAEEAPFVALAGAAAAIAYVAQRSAGAMADAAPLGWLQRAMQALYGSPSTSGRASFRRGCRRSTCSTPPSTPRRRATSLPRSPSSSRSPGSGRSGVAGPPRRRPSSRMRSSSRRSSGSRRAACRSSRTATRTWRASRSRCSRAAR
jgi:hypothetical protein